MDNVKVFLFLKTSQKLKVQKILLKLKRFGFRIQMANIYEAFKTSSPYCLSI